MLPPFGRRLWAWLSLLICISITAQAQSLTHVKIDTLEAKDVSAKAVVQAPLAPPTLDGVAAGLSPVAQVNQYGSVWLLATDPAGQQVWLNHTAAGWTRKTPPPATVEPALHSSGQAHILFVGMGADGRHASVYSYHTITDAWADFGGVEIPSQPHSIVSTSDGFILGFQNAEGQETFSQISLVLTKKLLKWVDWLIIVVYLVGTAAIGLYFYLKDKKQSNEEFFVGGRKIPWWAAGVSLYATGTSAVSYIAIPAKSFATNWLYLAANVVGIIGTVFVAIWIVPLIRRLNVMSVYHYLEMRFHPNIRAMASGIAILLQLGSRMSIVLFLPSLAMSAVTGLQVVPSILIMGVVTILYTVLGGMKAVIWTDFIQVFVMLGGAFFAIGYVFFKIDGGFSGFWAIAQADDKLKTFDWGFNLTEATVWGFLLVAVIGIITYPQDQVMMQRVLSTKSDKEAGWSVWTLAALIIPGSLTFFAIGTALYAFYKTHAERLNPTLSVDSTFPQFIAAELPAGLTGLIIAGIFAASMSTLSSCINSVATLVSVDFYERYAKNPTPAKSVRLAEWMTFVAGGIGVGTAVLLASFNIQSALDTSFQLAGLLGGGFAGCYGLGMLTKRANWQGAAIGVASSVVATFIVWMWSLVHPYFYAVIATSVCIVVGYITSYFFPAPTQSLTGLTVYTPLKKPLVAS